MKVLGLMSGTSLDGIDLALIETDGETVTKFGPAATVPYADDLRALGRAAKDAAQAHVPGADEPAPVREAAHRLTRAHAEAVARFRAEHDLADDAVDLVAFHGQTVLHRPEQRWTWQIGDGAMLARLVGRPVVSDFRSADVAAGGQGAPLVPLYHRALAVSAGLDRPVAILNLGGVGNVTWVDPHGADPVAFDTGPGNALIDDWVHAHGLGHMDEGGRIAARGRADEGLVARLLEHPYFDAPPPKSLDRDDFRTSPLAGLSVEDGAATLAAFTAAAVAAARAHFPQAVAAWYVTGGGRHNPTLMSALAARLDAPVATVETLGWRGDALEAEAFAFLAARAVRGLPLSLPTTTGVPAPQTGGRLHLPEQVA
jgi:anhydro-N-acetylmuramic acid kinase